MGIAFVGGFIGASVALLIGILIYGEVSQSIECVETNTPDLQQTCDKAKDMLWTVIGILPIAMFFVMFQMFGGFSEDTEKKRQPKKYRYNSRTGSYEKIISKKTAPKPANIYKAEPNVNEVGSLLGEIGNLFKRGNN